MEKSIAHYEVFELPLNFSDKIGEGSSANVFKLTLRNKKMAVKVIKTQFSQHKFHSIAKKLRQLKHKNVVRFKGYSTRPTALIFELCFLKICNVQISNLSQLIQHLNEQSSFSFLQRLNFIYQSSNGIMYLHESGIVHKDIKPSNLLVTGTTKDITIKVSDFDDFVDIKETIALSMTKQNINGMTLAYTSPEIIKCEVEAPNQKSDIYALAITAFEIFSDFSSAWHGIIPVLKDILLMNAIISGKRPKVNHLFTLYGEENISLHKFINLIQQGWQDNPSLRPTISVVFV
ncbi:interleukin-1 receptor-associated kinase 4-like [Hydra vulgaris]|uniref:Interleukin-1 receptor-associated kinase 4-like n=1 Tax=Hydra vulgaris TaxID=6087 RepID=A0ABM4DBR1_HYDVU